MDGPQGPVGGRDGIQKKKLIFRIRRLEIKKASWLRMGARYLHPCDRSETGMQVRRSEREILSYNNRLMNLYE